VRAHVERSRDDDLLRELDHHLARLEHGPVRTASVQGMFLPTGDLQELALADGWSGDYAARRSRAC